MLAKLERLIGEIGDLNSKLVLLVGASRGGKTKLLRELGTKLNIEPLNVGLELGRRLAATPINKRGFSAGEFEIGNENENEKDGNEERLEALLERVLLQLERLQGREQLFCLQSYRVTGDEGGMRYRLLDTRMVST